MTLDQLPVQQRLFEQLIAAYAADNLERIVATAALSHDQAQIPSARRFMKKLNDDRNHRMVQRITPYFNEGNTFIAVGALHLAGPNGILSLLRQNGCRTEPLRQNTHR